MNNIDVILTLNAEILQLHRIYGNHVENIVKELGRVVGEIATDDWLSAGLRLSDLVEMLPPGANVGPTFTQLSEEILENIDRKNP